jgi:RNA polymerase sigma factor (sigma-70 family)
MDSPLTGAARHRLVLDHMHLVEVVASGYRGGNVEFEDLLQIGREGLCKAAESFDGGRSEFPTWARTKIESAILDAARLGQAEWFPKDSTLPPLDSDKIEKIFEWTGWGGRGNAEAICETWSELTATPEELAIYYDDIRDKQAKFAAAFISLSVPQRKLVSWVFLDEPNKPATQAARELGVSYFQAVRMLKKALKIMREVITRMESNNSGGNTANGRPTLTGLHGCVPGYTTAAQATAERLVP